jgi:hypothetical protein
MAEKIQNLEDVSFAKLTDEERERLFAGQPLCVVNWTTRDGFPMGMPHDYVWDQGKFWVHTTTKRKRVKALTDRPQSCIVVDSGHKPGLPGGMVSAKTMATVHHGDRDLVRWLLPLFFDRVGWTDDQAVRDQMMELFDTPARVVISFDPIEMFTWSSQQTTNALNNSGFDKWDEKGGAE